MSARSEGLRGMVDHERRALSALAAFLISSRCSLTMGDISGGCHAVFSGFSGQAKGRSNTSPGVRAFSRTESASRSTARCPARSCTLPVARPYGYSIAATLGIPTSLWYSGVMVKTTVLKPLSSRNRATSPTDRQHSGQAGVSNTASVLSSFILEATFGIVSSSRILGSS